MEFDGRWWGCVGRGSPAVLLVLGHTSWRPRGSSAVDQGDLEPSRYKFMALWTWCELVWCSQGTTWVRLFSSCADVLALFALGKLDTSPLPSYLSVLLPCLGFRFGLKRLDISADPACSPLGSAVDTCSSRGFGRNFHIFYVAELLSALFAL